MHPVQRTTLNNDKQSSALRGTIIAVIISITGAIIPVSAATRPAVTTQTLYGDAVTIADAANPTSQVIPVSINDSGNMLARELPKSGNQYPVVLTISGVGSSATISQTLPQSPPTQSSYLVPGEPRVVGITDSGTTYGTFSICPADRALCFFHAGKWSPAGGQPTDLGYGGVLAVSPGGSFGGFYGVDTGQNNGAEKYTCGAFLKSGGGSIGFLPGTSTECDFEGTNGPYGDYGNNDPGWNPEVIATNNSGSGMLNTDPGFTTTAGVTLTHYEAPHNPAGYGQLMSDNGIIIGIRDSQSGGSPEGATWNAKTGALTPLPGISASQPGADGIAITASGAIVGGDDLGAALWTSPTAKPIQLADVGGPVLISGNGKYLVTEPPFGGGSDYMRYTRLDAPVVKSVGPTDGPAQGGQTIHVTGTNFKGATAINFELPDASEIPATSFSCQKTSCAVVTPDMSHHVLIARSHRQTRGQSRRDNGTPGELLTNVRITTDGGTSAVVAADQFTFSKVTVTNISANHGVLDQSGSSAPNIVISGTGFKQGKTNVFFVSQQGHSNLSETPKSVIWDSSTQLTVRLGHNVGQDLPPASDAASYPTNVIVHVGSDYAPVTAKDVYTFLPPTISNVSLR
ncbi:MAG TPA: IPT/TIG domain-containing protein, partial [Chloroflexota bacterium]|nr:IPT/TIG domain-containing protein [Chloroflexota bacterium]